MPFQKFKPQKQYGVHYTELFKLRYKARNNVNMHRLEVPTALRAMGVEIHDPNSPSFLAEDTSHLARADQLPQFRKTTDRVLTRSTESALYRWNSILGPPFVEGDAVLSLRRLTSLHGRHGPSMRSDQRYEDEADPVEGLRHRQPDAVAEEPRGGAQGLHHARGAL